MLESLNWQMSWKENTVPVSSSTTICHCTLVDTMHYSGSEVLYKVQN